MKRRGMISEDLLHSIDVMNSLHGGISEPIVSLQQHENYREIKCAVPGVENEELKVEIHNNFLAIYYLLNLESDGKVVPVPRVIYNKAIPYFVDATRVSATREERFLQVTLPFNELANGYHKQISIED